MQYSLSKKVSKQIDDWVKNAPMRIGRNAWITAKEGKMFIRYNRGFNRLDLATFNIKEKYQQKGVSREIIEMSAGKPIRTIRIENIQVPKWAAKLAEMRFPDRDTVVKVEMGELGVGELGLFTVDFVKQSGPEDAYENLLLWRH